MRTLNKTLLINVVAILLFLALVAGLIVHAVQEGTQTNIENQYSLLSDELEAAIARRDETHARMAAALAYSQVVQDALYAKEPASRYRSILQAQQTMFNYMFLDPDLRGVMVYAGDDARIDSASAYLGLGRETLAPWLDGRPMRGAQRALIPYRGSYSFLYIYPFRLLNEQNGSAARTDGKCFLLYNISSILDMERFHPDLIRDYALLIGDQALPISNTTSALDTWKTSGFGEDITRVSSGGLSYHVLSLRVPGLDARLLCTIQQPSNSSARVASWSFLALMVCAMVVLAICFISFFGLARDIRKLTGSVESVRQGQSQVIQPVRFSELNRLAAHCNDLLQTVHRKNQENLQSQQKVYDAMLARDRAVMAYYRQQIDPHFLFNTLEAMRGMAQYYQVPPLENMIFTTSRMLHYSLYAPFYVPFSEEIRCARNYMALMNERKQGAYDYAEEIQPEAMEHVMLSLVLQPLMENAIRHGSRHIRRRLCLTLTARVDGGGFLCVTLKDNGCGMDAAQLGEVRARIAAPDGSAESGHIGIRNIAKRLISADSRCTFEVDSAPDEGTEIRLRIPEIAVQDLPQNPLMPDADAPEKAEGAERAEGTEKAENTEKTEMTGKTP